MSYCKLISACAVLAATVGFAAPAMAGPLTSPTSFTINTFVNGGSPITGNYGTISLVTDSGNPNQTDITVTMNSPYGLVTTGSANDVIDFELTGFTPPVTISNNTPGFTLGSAGGYGTPGATGTFNFAILCDSATCGTGGNNPYTGSFSFDINVPIGDFTVDDKGFYFAADICTNVVSSRCAGQTGPATTTTTTNNVPEPITLSLFGAGLAGAAALRRRRKKA
jgi:hypothetical protein